jgi:hypothetical protein
MITLKRVLGWLTNPVRRSELILYLCLGIAGLVGVGLIWGQNSNFPSGGSGTSSGNLSANAATKAIYATDPQWAGGVKGGAVYVCDGTWTNSSQTVTQSNAPGFTDPPFTSAVIGDVIWGSTGGACQANGPTSTQVPLGTITSVNNANSVQISTTTTGACSSSAVAQCTFVYSKYDDTAALQAAWNGANAICGVLILPSTNMLISGNITGPSTGQCGISNIGNGGGPPALGVWGQGKSKSVIIVSPALNTSSCLNGTYGCIFANYGGAQNNVDFQNFSVDCGGANTLAGAQTNQSLIALGPLSDFENGALSA